MTRKRSRFTCRSKPPRFKQVILEGSRKRTVFHRQQFSLVNNEVDKKTDVFPSTSAVTQPDVEQQPGPAGIF